MLLGLIVFRVAGNLQKTINCHAKVIDNHWKKFIACKFLSKALHTQQLTNNEKEIIRSCQLFKVDWSDFVIYIFFFEVKRALSWKKRCECICCTHQRHWEQTAKKKNRPIKDIQSEKTRSTGKNLNYSFVACVVIISSAYRSLFFRLFLILRNFAVDQ